MIMFDTSDIVEVQIAALQVDPITCDGLKRVVEKMKQCRQDVLPGVKKKEETRRQVK